MRESRMRLEEGQPIRDAMKGGRWRLQSLAARTREVDPEGKGVSFQLIAFLASDREWSRESTSPRSASLIASALEVEEGNLFASRSKRTDEDSAQQREAVTAA